MAVNSNLFGSRIEPYADFHIVSFHTGFYVGIRTGACIVARAISSYIEPHIKLSRKKENNLIYISRHINVKYNIFLKIQLIKIKFKIFIRSITFNSMTFTSNIYVIISKY